MIFTAKQREEFLTAAQPLMSWLAANCMEGICGGPSPSTPSQESPQEPTRAMLDAARDWSNKKYGKAIGDDAARGCWQAMLAALSSSSREVRP